jgi:hypothetical protein
VRALDWGRVIDRLIGEAILMIGLEIMALMLVSRANERMEMHEWSG